jgi:hypothetical protein
MGQVSKRKRITASTAGGGNYVITPIILLIPATYHQDCIRKIVEYLCFSAYSGLVVIILCAIFQRLL